MARKILGGAQDFAEIRQGGYFYIDKTAFIRDWWDGSAGSDKVTLITRPRRFGKTLMMSTVKYFFSTEHAGRSDLFEGLDVWKDEEMRALQGTYPVISLSWADIKGDTFTLQRAQITQEIAALCADYADLNTPEYLNDVERRKFTSVINELDVDETASSLKLLCKILYKKYGKKVTILLDEYDTPLQEAWVNGFWNEIVKFLRNLFNTTFKKNEYLERAILTGITRVSKESMFSDMNNLDVASICTPEYMTAFGFTEDEVFAAMDEFGLTDKEGVRKMYDGYIIGGIRGIYNPWSVTRYLKVPMLRTWWANTSSNALAGKLIQEGSHKLKQNFETLLEGGAIVSKIDEDISYDQLDDDSAVWSLLLASGYLKLEKATSKPDIYELSLVNGEIRQTMPKLVASWFRAARSSYGYFVVALLENNVDDMNEYMNKVALSCFSYFDTGGSTEDSEPERFYHGFVIGLLVELRDRYILSSNRESGIGRYDIMLEPRKPTDPAFIIEFKVHKPKQENSLQDTVNSALAQIRAKGYEQQLIERGISADRIHKYGFAFKGKEVLIG